MGGFGVEVGLGMLTFLELNTWLMRLKDKILASLGALCGRRNCKYKAKKTLGAGGWELECQTHNVHTTKSIESAKHLSKTHNFDIVDMYRNEETKKFQ